nr:disease resistance protein [Tanacetum cinerariifolium]
MEVTTDRLLKHLDRLRTKADSMLIDTSLNYEFTPFIDSSRFKILCRKAVSVCIVDPLWRIVHLSAPELIKFLLEEEGYASLGVGYWLKSLPKVLYEVQAVVDHLGDTNNWGILDRCMWHEVNNNDEVKDMLEMIKSMLADYFPVLVDEAPSADGILDELKMVIDVMLILCCEFVNSDEEFVVFDVKSRKLLEGVFTERQLELLALAGRLPSKQNVGEEENVVGFEELQ